MKENYFKKFLMIEQLHRFFLEILKIELEKMNITDINPVQCIVIYNMGLEKVTVGDMTKRGYYIGTNVSYNLRNMVKSGYLVQEVKVDDTRSSFVKLSPKGIKIYKKLDELFSKHAEGLDTHLEYNRSFIDPMPGEFLPNDIGGHIKQIILENEKNLDKLDRLLKHLWKYWSRLSSRDIDY